MIQKDEHNWICCHIATGFNPVWVRLHGAITWYDYMVWLHGVILNFVFRDLYTRYNIRQFYYQYIRLLATETLYRLVKECVNNIYATLREPKCSVRCPQDSETGRHSKPKIAMNVVTCSFLTIPFDTIRYTECCSTKSILPFVVCY
jgi:hypothetical protein